MKTKLISLILMLLIGATALFSCNFLPIGTGNGNDNEEENENNDNVVEEKENLIYNATSELYLIVDPEVNDSLVSSLSANLSGKREELLNYDSPYSEQHKHEIVIGNLDRSISKTAIDRISRYDKKNDDEFVFVVYSDGSSVALVWEEESSGVVEQMAIEYFVQNYVKDELVMKPGADIQAINVLDDYLRVRDSEYKETTWANYEKKYGKALTDSLKQLYAIYSGDCITWLANLYDPDICVCQDLYGEAECSGTKYCGTGGFYFSNSARDTLGYLPDVESTHQALNFLTSAGLDGSYLNIISEEMKKQIGDFVYALEEPNGYFYHPQWGIAFTDTKITRRSRDLSWATSILVVFGRTPKYTTAAGVKGEDALGSSGRLTERLGSSVCAVSKVIATADDAPAPHLQDEASFREYLDSKDIKNNSYGVGSEIGSQTSQIKARDKQIGTPDNPTPLMSMLIEWLNANQNPETGNWDWKKPGDEGYIDYHGTNGLLKIGGIYTEHGVEMPYAKEAALSAMADIINPAEVNQVVDLYNTWFGIKNILNNLKECGGATGKDRAEEIRLELLAIAPEAILISRDKIAKFLKPDGSASYGLNYSSSTAQGCPSAVPGTIEGDVNGSTIAINGIIGNITAALSIGKPNLFGSAEKYIFTKTINGLSPITKVDSAAIPEYLTFDYEDVGAPSEEVTILEGNGGTQTVIADPTKRSDGNVFEIVSNTNGGDTIKIPVQNVSGIANSYVFEGDFYIASAGSDYLLQLTIDACYMLTFRQVTDKNDPDYGRIRIVESSSGTGTVSVDRYLGITVDKNSWFKLKMEYYYGTDEDVRIKVYADLDLTDDKGESLYAISDNYRDESGKKVNTGSSTPSKSFYISQIYVMRSASMKMYVDNLNCYVSREGYSAALGKDDAPFINVDTEGAPEKKYDFNDGNISDDITVSENGAAVGVTDGKLTLSGVGGSSGITLPVTVREAMAKCAEFCADITVVDSAVGKDALFITGMDDNNAIFGIALTCMEDSDGKYLAVVPKALTADAPIEGVRIALGESFNLKLDYYHREDVVLIYVNGSFVGASTKLYDEGNRRILSGVSVSTGSGSETTVLLDDVTVEMTAAILDEAVAPDKDEKVYTFDESDPEVKTTGSGTSIKTVDGGKAMVIDSSKVKGSVTVPVNVRATVVNSVNLSMKLSYLTLPTSGNLHKISLLDEDENVILAYAVGYYDGKIGVYEVGAGGILSTALVSYEKDETAEISIEVFGGKTIVHFLNNKKVVAKSSIFVGEEYLDGGFSSLRIESLEAKSSVALDDLKCEAVYNVYKPAALTSANNPETDLSEGITFDHSSSGNLPSLMHTLTYSDNLFNVKNVYNEVTGEYSNVLVFSKTGAGNDELGFTSSGDNSAAKAVVFEADLKLDLTSAGIAYRISFGQDKKGKDPMYMIQINKTSSGDIYIEDISTSGNNPIRNSFAITPNNGDWFHVKVEMVQGNRDEVKFIVSVNGQLAYESTNFAGSHDASATPKALPKAVSFYCIGATRGEMYFDNVKLYAID